MSWFLLNLFTLQVIINQLTKFQKTLNINTYDIHKIEYFQILKTYTIYSAVISFIPGLLGISQSNTYHLAFRILQSNGSWVLPLRAVVVQSVSSGREGGRHEQAMT